MNPDDWLIFHEKQKIAAWFRWLMIINVPLIIFIVHTVSNLNENAQPKPESFHIVLLFLIAGPAFLFCKMKLETNVRNDGIYIKLSPFHFRFKKYPFDQISQYYARDYKPIAEYGGWGIRNSRTNGKAFNMSGSRGVQLILTDGKKVLIGSQKPEQFVNAIKSVKSPNIH
jgi:hypothetical protein